MIYRFGDLRLDRDRAELRGARGPVAMEPKAFSLLCLLVENHDRVVSKEEMIDSLWGGRVVSEAAVSTLVKTVRKALGDDGDAQRLVRTVRGRGFRFVAEVTLHAPARAPPVASLSDATARAAESGAPAGSKPKLAVLPFTPLRPAGASAPVADAIPADLIASLSRLRWLDVVARESTFRFRGPDVDLDALHGLLGATYCLTGSVEVQGRRLAVAVELSDTRSRAVVWADRFSPVLDDVHEARSGIASAVLAALELRIPLNEAALARSRPSERLDAWGLYHLGLQHMVRFNRHDNAVAAGHFERATRLDPNFASAFAAWSFTGYQAAAMGYAPDRAAAIAATRAHADRSVELDPMDPFANFAQGRIHFLLGRPDDGAAWLDRSVELSPSYAKGHYARGLADMLSGRASDCHGNMDRALALSPLDPLLCAMLSGKGVAHLLQGDPRAGADWAVRGARAPQAHAVILMTAVAACRLAGDAAGARRWADALRERHPDAAVQDYFTTLPFTDPGARRILGDALVAAGLPRASRRPA